MLLIMPITAGCKYGPSMHGIVKVDRLAGCLKIRLGDNYVALKKMTLA